MQALRTTAIAGALWALSAGVGIGAPIRVGVIGCGLDDSLACLTDLADLVADQVQGQGDSINVEGSPDALGDISGGDGFQILSSTLSSSDPTDPTDGDGDANGGLPASPPPPGLVDNGGQGPSLARVSEPALLALLGAGFTAVGARLRRRRAD